jgi:hypothetical protein
MTTEQLRRAIHANPFVPFSLRLADSRSLRVPHPDFIAHLPNGRTAFVYDEDGTGEVIDLLLVVGIRFEPAKSNGKPKKGRG